MAIVAILLFVLVVVMPSVPSLVSLWDHHQFWKREWGWLQSDDFPAALLPLWQIDDDDMSPRAQWLRHIYGPVVDRTPAE